MSELIQTHVTVGPNNGTLVVEFHAATTDFESEPMSLITFSDHNDLWKQNIEMQFHRIKSKGIANRIWQDMKEANKKNVRRTSAFFHIPDNMVDQFISQLQREYTPPDRTF